MSTSDLEALDVLSSLVLEDGEVWGDRAESIQWDDATAILDRDRSTPLHFLTRSRGRSKSTDLAGMALSVMATQAPRAAKLYALASDRDQGRLLLDAAEGFIARTPLIANDFEGGAWRVVHLSTGASLDVLAADAAGSWGLRPFFVIVDEIAQWESTSAPKKLWESVSSSVAKMSNARLVVLTSAGDPAHWSKKVLDHAAEDRLWRVHEVRGPAPWLDPVRLEEQRRRLPESSYMRLFENQWTPSEDRLTNLDDLRACITLDGPLEAQLGKKYLIGVDIGLKKDRTVAAVCHREEGVVNGQRTRRITLDRMQVWQGTRAEPVKLDEVETWIAQASSGYNRARIIIDPWQAVGLAQRLKSRGIRVEEFTFSSASVGRLASSLHQALRNRQLALPHDEDLIDELSNVRLREMSPGVLRMDHIEGQHDDRAIALALCLQELLDHSVIPTIDATRWGALNSGLRKESWAEIGGSRANDPGEGPDVVRVD